MATFNRIMVDTYVILLSCKELAGESWFRSRTQVWLRYKALSSWLKLDDRL